MQKLPIFFVFITALHIAPSTCAAQAQNTKASNPQCAKVKFHRLNQYKHKSWARVFRDREVTKVLRPLLGKDYRLLIESMQQVSYPEDSLSLVDPKGVLTLRVLFRACLRFRRQCLSSSHVDRFTPLFWIRANDFYISATTKSISIGYLLQLNSGETVLRK